MGRPSTFDPNKVYGLLTPIERSPEPDKWGAPRWVFRCECGNTKTIRCVSVSSGLTKTCGCGQKNRTDRGKRSRLFTGHEEIGGSYWASIKCRAKSHNRDFDITPKQAWDLFVAQNRRCAISGIDIHFSNSRNKTGTASLDRIDSNKGYTLDNIQWLHRVVNMMKNDLVESDFLQWCKVIYENQQLQNLSPKR